MVDHPLDLLGREPQHRGDGLEHVVLARHVSAQHVVEHHVLEILLTGSLPRGHPLEPPDSVLQVLNLILIPLRLHGEVELELPQTGLGLVLLLPQLLDLHVLPRNLLKGRGEMSDLKWMNYH